MSKPPRSCSCACSASPHDARLVALPVAVFFGGALVVLLLAFGKPDLELGAAFLPVQVERHERIALALDAADEARQLGLVQQQLARADRIRDHVRRRGLEW